MKTVKKLILVSLVLLAFFSCKNNQKEKTETTVETEMEHVTELTTQIAPLFENDYATVTKVSLEPGQEQELHQGGERLIYSLNDYTIAWEENGNDLGEKSWKKGDAHSHAPGMHKAKNVGNEVAEWLVFTRTGTELPPCDKYDDGNDVNSVKPESTSVLLDDEYFMAMQVTLNPNESIPDHNGINRVIYALSDYSIEYMSDHAGSGNKTFKKGDVHWHEACKHSIKNIGTTTAEFLVVVYKK
ncbi:MAG: cupin domain-containing protein [Flagellimonas sp.]